MMPLDRCPRCDHALGAPLKSSGRQVCMKCGWSDRARQASPAPSADAQPELSAADIKRLLARATEESLENMKPKYRKGQSAPHPLQPNPPNRQDMEP